MENRDRPYGPRTPEPKRPLSRTRRAVLEMLRDQPEPTTLAALVRLSDLHENTVRGHVDALVGLGLVRREQAPPSGRGRPPWRYALTESAAVEGAPAGSNEYAALASVLADTLGRTAPDPAAAGAQAGIEWGRRLARDRGAQPLPGDEARAAVHELLGDLGFAPEAVEGSESRDLRLTRCPLLEAAYRNPEVTCSVHRGIVQGAFAEYGHPGTDSELEPFAEPGACRLTLPILAAEPTATPGAAE